MTYLCWTLRLSQSPIPFSIKRSLFWIQLFTLYGDLSDKCQRLLELFWCHALSSCSCMHLCEYILHVGIEEKHEELKLVSNPRPPLLLNPQLRSIK